MGPGKIEAIVKCSIPKSVKGIRDFLGLTGYYRCFIQANYGQSARC